MRRIVGIGLPVLVLLSLITGIVESHSDGHAHIFISVLMVIFSGIHTGLNWKAFTRYCKTGKKLRKGVTGG